MDKNNKINDYQRWIESMDMMEALEEIKVGIAHLAERPGMQPTGKRIPANVELSDARSPIEIPL